MLLNGNNEETPKDADTNLKEHSESPSADIKVTACDDTRQLEEDGEPTTHPHPVLGTHRHVLQVVVSEHLRQTIYS